MKKFTKILCTILSVLMLITAVPMASVSAAGKVTAPTVTLENADKGIAVSWTKAKKATKYTVYRKLASDKKYTKIFTFKTTAAGEYLDQSAKDGKTYKYIVKASNKNSSANSKAVKTVRLATPEIWADTGDGGITVGLTSPVKGAKKIQVFRAEVKDGVIGKYTKVDTLDPTDEWDFFEDYDTVNGIFQFKIRAVKGNYKSAFSEIIRVDHIQKTSSYSELNSDKTGVDITWNKMDQVEGFRIYRSVNGKGAKVLADIKLEDCVLNEDNKYYIYTDTSIENGNTYTYYMQAYDGYRVSNVEETFTSVTVK